jgi:hypothetical protein
MSISKSTEGPEYDEHRDFTPAYYEYAWMFFVNLEDGWSARLVQTPYYPGEKVVSCYQTITEYTSADCFYVYDTEKNDDDEDRDVVNIHGFQHHINLYFEDIV